LIGAGTNFDKSDLFSYKPSEIAPVPTEQMGGAGMPKMPASHFIKPVSGGRQGVIRFPHGSKRFTAAEINAGHRKVKLPVHGDGWDA
jgi:hypothetical protein